MPRALITGITGQDGSYLAELLLSKGYEVHGIVRQATLDDPARRMWRITHLLSAVHLHEGSLEHYPGIHRAVADIKPDECYHLAAQSFVSTAIEDEAATLNTNIRGTHFLLAALHEARPECRFYFAGSSEMFGRVSVVPQNEETPFHPRSAYGISKVAGFDLMRNYRENYRFFAAAGILFNHESPRRGLEFVTRKITHAVARIACGRTTELHLGNLDAQRDWGHAAEYVPTMWQMLQQPEPDDFVIATGETHTVREFCEAAFRCVDKDYLTHVVVDQSLFRPADDGILRGDSSKARRVLGWRPVRSFFDLVEEMVDSDIRLLKDQGE